MITSKTVKVRSSFGTRTTNPKGSKQKYTYAVNWEWAILVNDEESAKSALLLDGAARKMRATNHTLALAGKTPTQPTAEALLSQAIAKVLAAPAVRTMSEETKAKIKAKQDQRKEQLALLSSPAFLAFQASLAKEEDMEEEDMEDESAD